MQINNGRHASPIVGRRGMLWLSATLVWACSGTLTDVTPISSSEVASVAVNPATATVALGTQLPLQAVATDADGKVIASPTIIWTVRDSSIATVSPTGVVQGRALGSTAVAASAGGKSGVSVITVQKTAVNSVVVRPSHVDAVAGKQAQLTAIALDASQNPLTGRVFTWSSSDVAVATVDTTGLVTAIAPGSATITGTAEGKSDVATVSVTQASVASLTITPNPLSMSVGQSTGLTATVVDQSGNVLSGRVVTWTSSDPTIASVSSSGVVTAIIAGSVTVTATSEGKTATSSVTVSNFAVGDVSVQPQTQSVIERSSTQLSAIVKDVTGAIVTGRLIVWTTSNAAIATVSSTGLVTGVTPGVVTITATSEGKSGSATVTVTPAPVAKVVVSPSAPNVIVGQTATLVAALFDVTGAGLSGRVVTWTSSNAAVATVSSVGLVTGVSVGTSTITATSEGQSGTATVTVSPTPAASVTVSPSTTSVNVGSSTPLAATVKDASGNVLTGRVVAWTSSAPAAATVSASGVVTGVALGTATITATVEGKSGTATVAVPVPVGSLTLPAALSLTVGQTATPAPVVKDANGVVVTDRLVTWGTNAAAVATVSSSGLVTGISAGSATITATSEGKSGSTAVTVTVAPVATVVVSPSTPSLTVGGTVPLAATLKDASGNVLTGRTVTWSSGTPAAATVSATGLVTAVATGTSTITATSEGKTGTAAVTVTPPPAASVTVTPLTTSLVAGATAPLTAVVKDAGGNVLVGAAVTWASGTPATATVSATGVVTGVAPGTSTITATSGNASGTASVTVTLAPVATVAVSPSAPSLTVAGTVTLSATLKDASGNVLTGRTVTWSSSALLVATVSTGGLVTALLPGTSTITATSEGKTGTATVTVTLVPAATVTVTPSSATLSVGGTTPLTAVVKDAGGNVLVGRTVTWLSGTPAAATVSATGVVTAVAGGTATITATSGSASGTSAITVLAPVATVAVSPPTSTLPVGGTVALAATLKDASGNVLTGRAVAWSSGTPAAATVDPITGLVTAAAVGTSTITATSEGKTGTASVTVTLVPAASVTVTPPSATLSVGGTTPLTAVVKDAGGNVLVGRTVTWLSGTPAAATVSATGVVTAVAGGTSTITATSGSASGSSAITVLVPVATVTLSPPTSTLAVGGTVALTATLKDASGNVLTGRTVAWSSGIPAVATVDPTTGLVTAVASGASTIIAMSEGKTGTASVTVLVPVATVAVTPSAPSLMVGGTVTLTATLKDANNNVLTGRTVSWSSATTAVATVSASGLVTGVSDGTATITATSEGKIGTATVTVIGAVASVTVTPSAATVSVNDTKLLAVVAKDSHGNVITGLTFGWSSNNATVASVDSSGLVTAKKIGTASITASVDGESGSSFITVVK